MAEGLKSFQRNEIKAAYAWAAEGGTAIHLHRDIPNYHEGSKTKPRAPKCFRDAIDRGENIAHVFDQDYARLVTMARSLGVVNILVEHRGTPSQHVDLCGSPLRKLLQRVRT